MLDKTVEKTYKKFVKRWNELLNVSPELELDSSWPSISVLDQLTFSLRLHEDLSEAQEELLEGSAAYLAVFVHTCWSLIAEEVKVGIDHDGIFVSAKGGEFIPDEEEIYFHAEKNFTRLVERVDGGVIAVAVVCQSFH